MWSSGGVRSMASDGGPLAALAGVRVAYPAVAQAMTTPALDGVDLALARGEVLALVGASGSGKSTLALALLGLLPREAAATGTFAWSGARLPLGGPAHAALRGTALGYVPQDAAASLNPYLRVGLQVEEAIAHAPDRMARRRRALALMARAALDQPAALAVRYPHQLSGGQCQRVVIACATANDPALLVADEPTSALDPLSAAEVLGLLVRLARARGSALVLVSHDLAAVAACADRVAVIEAGRIVETGAPAALLVHPRAAATRRLVAAAQRVARAA
jgi:ABC-type glutathione transport system ATPase component